MTSIVSTENMFWRGANVLITGVSGSLGSALTRELLQPEYGISRLAGIARKWQPIQELQREVGDDRFRPFIGDVRDIDRLRVAFRGVDCIFHAAALKDIVLSEYNPSEAIATNINGSWNVFQAAMDCGVGKVLLISSDKASAPSSLYGVTKKAAEHLATGYNVYSGALGTRYASARYGNVAGSSGSVIPLFRKQKEAGKITITHPAMTRFWLTMNQAVKFIVACMVNMRGGEVYVPHLPSSRVMSIASAIAPEAEVEIVGIRPAEKLHEVMITPDEAPRTRDLGWAYRVSPAFSFWDRHAKFSDGSPVPVEWTYSSASAQRLGDDEIKVILES